MGKVILSGVSRSFETPVILKANFADNTWEAIIKACKADKVPESWVVGDQKTMTINGIDYAIDIIGKKHDIYADLSDIAPLTFQLHDLYATAYQMNSSDTNKGGWTDCAMRNTHLPAILSLMPSEVQAGIKEVNKLTTAGSQSSTINTTADKLFLLSEIEVHGAITYSKVGEGSQYAYYSAGNSKIKTYGSNEMWFNRSPNVNNDAWCMVNNAGSAGVNSATYTRGVSFAFCF